MFRIIPLWPIASIIAPDLPGFGQSDMPARATTYTFDRIATSSTASRRSSPEAPRCTFLTTAPAGFRMAAKHPDRITASSRRMATPTKRAGEGWNRSGLTTVESHRKALRAFLTPQTTHWQYTHGVADETKVSPDGQSLDNFYLARPGADEVQLDLFGDYKSNVALYPAFQNYFRTHKPPLLAVWGKNDPFFLPPGAEAFKRDIPEAVVRFFDTGHFALETHAGEIAAAIRDFVIH